MVLLSLFCFFSKFAVSPIPPDVHLDSVLPVFCLGEVFVSEERAFFWTFPNLISIFIVIVIVFASVTASVFLTEIVELFSWAETVRATDSWCVGGQQQIGCSIFHRLTPRSSMLKQTNIHKNKKRLLAVHCFSQCFHKWNLALRT